MTIPVFIPQSFYYFDRNSHHVIILDVLLPQQEFLRVFHFEYGIGGHFQIDYLYHENQGFSALVLLTFWAGDALFWGGGGCRCAVHCGCLMASLTCTHEITVAPLPKSRRSNVHPLSNISRCQNRPWLRTTDVIN